MDNNQNVEKNSNKKKIAIVVIVISFILMAVSGTMLFLNKDGNNKKIDEDEVKVLRKILPDELNDETAAEIIQFMADTKMKKDKWKITNANLVATDGNDGFVVNYESKNKTGKWFFQTILTYENDTWTIELPQWQEGEKDVSKYDIVFGYEID